MRIDALQLLKSMVGHQRSCHNTDHDLIMSPLMQNQSSGQDIDFESNMSVEFEYIDHCSADIASPERSGGAQSASPDQRGSLYRAMD